MASEDRYQESRRRARQAYENRRRESGGKRYAIRLSADTVAAVAELAKRNGATETETVTNLVERAVNTERLQIGG